MGRLLRTDQIAATSFWWRTTSRVLVGSPVRTITCWERLILLRFGGAETPSRVILRSLSSGYSWGAASLAHLYRSLCRASRFNCKKMDGPLILLFVWAWERMPFLAPIPRDQLSNIGVPLARWWSHWRRHTRYIRRPTAHFRRGLDDMGVDDFIWRPYMGVEIPDGLASHMIMSSTQSPLVSFECIEWHATDRVRRQFGMQQLPPGPAFNLGRDHCKRLTGAQNHDWGQIYSQWVNRWTFDRYNTVQLGEEIIDFHLQPSSLRTLNT
ncbi:serine/threonine-protein phosphatase 7 long form homolog [Arachis stenosperma]|uniref:serine/threonine-protein phosphatase 7 long form homolog n=1 Tax=Arachis stenosperma TaxID=217475 RepID=UPI0025AD9B52|nr:serine/threonine-protein phosphatase 7 long form homolog [Arachis stenosperma]